jgi:glycosyltransferase involved in cell wall biosynthesis
VVVPVYNPGSYLRRCTESLVSQTMPPQDYEVIFVDDGSADGTPARLDELAAAWPQVRVIHQENSGWPGKPRNVGIEAACGRYVFFCDADDWLAPEALTSLYEFAEANHSDVVLPKMAGFGRPIPHHAFRETLGQTSLADGPLMESLTPHKLFRRNFLNEHQIRFPEGVRRLEDHNFVVTAYLLARVVSIYADRTCYTHIRRDDAGNISSRPVEWGGYFDNLAEVIEVVERHTTPGPLRDRIFRRWLHAEMVARLSGQRLLKHDPEEAASLFENAHRVAAAHFGPGVVELLQPVLRPVGRAIIDGDAALVWHHAETMARWRTRAELLQMSWTGCTLQISGIVSQLDDVGDPASTEPREVRFLRLLSDDDARSAAQGFRSSSLALQLTERTTGEQWPITAKLHRSGLAAGFTADIDVTRAAGGQPLALGIWELHAHFRVLGLGNRVRLSLVQERVPAGFVQPAPPSSTLPALMHVADQGRGVTLEIGRSRSVIAISVGWLWRGWLGRGLRRRAGRAIREAKAFGLTRLRGTSR